MSAALHPDRTYETTVVGVVERDSSGRGYASRVRRISVGALFAGLVAALSLQILLSVLGLALGAWSISPTTEANPFSGLGTAAGIWWIVTGVLSLFAGGWVAGRLAGVPKPLDGALHGMVTWGLVTLLSFWMVTSAVGSILSATAWTLGQGVSAAAQGVSSVAGAAVDAGQAAAEQANLPSANVSYERLGDQLAQTLRETDTPELQPDQLQTRVDQLTATARDAAADALTRPDSAQHQLDRVLDAFYGHAREVGQAVDQQAVASVVAANSDMSEQEANRVVDRWQNQYVEAKAALDRREDQLSREMSQTMEEVEQNVRVAGENVSDAVGNAATWSFACMLLGMVAAVGGGALGAPKTAVPTERSDSESDDLRRTAEGNDDRPREIRRSPR